MELILNGEKTITVAQNVLELLCSSGITPAHVAVEHNRSIIPRKDYETTLLNTGDRIEIVHFVGGG